MARILLIDDDQEILDLESLYLSATDYDVFTANTAQQAFNLLELYQVDLVIVDIEMPVVNGFQFVNKIKNDKQLQNLPIAFRSSRNEKDDILRAAKLGTDFYIVKPTTKEDFLLKINSFFEKNPPAEQQKLELQANYAADTKVHLTLQITAVMDFGVEVVTPQPLIRGQLLEVTSNMLLEVGFKHTLLKVMKIKDNKATLVFIDPKEGQIKQLKKWIKIKASNNKEKSKL